MTAQGPIVKTMRVAATTERAFRFFTQRMEAWWPFATHSVLKGERVRFDGPIGPGATIAEHAADGKVCPWGKVTVWEPPSRLTFLFGAWAGWDMTTEVEVRFIADGDGTRVELEHRGWERLKGENLHGERAQYETGWDVVVNGFEKGAAEEFARAA
jgi:hypothetical protein